MVLQRHVLTGLFIVLLPDQLVLELPAPLNLFVGYFLSNVLGGFESHNLLNSLFLLLEGCSQHLQIPLDHLVAGIHQYFLKG